MSGKTEQDLNSLRLQGVFPVGPADAAKIGLDQPIAHPECVRHTRPLWRYCPEFRNDGVTSYANIVGRVRARCFYHLAYVYQYPAALRTAVPSGSESQPVLGTEKGAGDVHRFMF
jgi:hypothetical protein